MIKKVKYKSIEKEKMIIDVLKHFKRSSEEEQYVLQNDRN